VSKIDPNLHVKSIDGLTHKKTIFNHIKEKENNEKYISEQIQGEMSSWLDSPDL
jgi:hypothetical protein